MMLLLREGGLKGMMFFWGVRQCLLNQNLIIIINNPFLFNFHNQSMLIARIISKLPSLNSSLRLALPFSTTPSTNFFLIQSKIFSTKNCDEFFEIYEKNRDEFTGELVSSVSRHLNSLVSRRDYRLNFSKVQDLVDNIAKSSNTSFSEKKILSLLSVLRSLRVKGFVSSSLNNLKTQLVEQYSNLIREKRAEQLDLSELISAYNQLVFFRSGQSRKVANKILDILDEGVAQGRIPLSNNQVCFLMYCLSCQQDRSSLECRIRQILLRRVTEQLSSIKLHELVKVAASLNRMDFYDLTGEEFSLVRLITQRVTDNITDLEEESIFEIIRGEFNSKFNGFYRIYEEINKNIFNQIAKDGTTSFNIEDIFKILTHLANKINLESLSKENQQKFFAFLEVYAKECKSTESKEKSFGFVILNLIQNNYFSKDHKSKLISIFNNYQLPINTNLLYQFAVRNYDISSLTAYIAQYDLTNIKEEILIKVGIIAYRMSKQNAEANAIYEQISQKIEEIISTPELFISFTRRMARYSIELRNFHQSFAKIIEKLPNPFDSAQKELPANYRGIYLNYIHEGSQNMKDFSTFTQTYDANITPEDFNKLAYHYFNRHGQKRQIEVNRPILFYVNRKINSFLEGKHKGSVQASLTLLNMYSGLAISRSLDGASEHIIFKTLHYLITKIHTINQLGLLNDLFYALEKYITKNYRRYHVETNYKSLVKHLLTHLDLITSKKSRLINQVIEAALRLNILTNQHLEKVDLESIKHLSFVDRSRLSYIKDPTFTPKIERISQAILPLIFSNLNLENLLTTNEKKIIEILQTVHPKELGYYLIVFKHQKPQAGTRIFSEILTNLIARIKNFELVDMTSIFQNAMNYSFTYVWHFKKLTEMTIEEYRKRLGSYSIEAHLELIRFIITQPTLNPREYYSELMDFVERREEIQDSQYDQLLVRLASTNYAFKEKELKAIGNTMKRNIMWGYYLTLMLENQIEPADRSQYIKDFCSKITEHIQTNKTTLNKFHYLYIKKKYPSESAELNLDESQLHFDKQTIRPRDAQIINTIVRLSGGNSEELDFGKDNFFLKIKNVVITFLLPRKIGAYYENQFIKRAIPVIRQEDLSVICVNLISSNISGMLQYINKAAPHLFNQEEFSKTFMELKQAEEKHKTQKRELKEKNHQ